MTDPLIALFWIVALVALSWAIQHEVARRRIRRNLLDRIRR